jgi:hypothetical protein
MLLLVLSFVLFGSSRADEPRKTPNLLIDVSAAAMNSLVRREVDRTEPAQDVIQETPVTGKARTIATIRAELISDQHQAALDIVFDGRVYGQTVGTRPHVLIYTSSTTSLEIRQRVVFDAKGIRFCPIPACAQSTITLCDIMSREEPDALAIRFAQKAFQKNVHLAEAETAYKSAGRAAKGLEEELTPALSSASKSIGKALKAFRRAGLAMEPLEFQSTPDFLEARLHFDTASENQPATAPLLPSDIDVGLRIHESLVNEVARKALGGKVIDLNKVNDFYDVNTLGLIRDGRKDDLRKNALLNLAKLLGGFTGKSTTIILAQKDPVTVTFTDQGFQLEVHVASIRQDKTIYQGMRVRSVYRFENSRAGVHAVRKEPVQFIALTDAEKKGEAQPASFLVLREVLFAEVMKDRLTLAPLPVVASIPGLRLEAPRSGARDGWFALAWKLAPGQEK